MDCNTDLEALMTHLGDFGKYQLSQFMLLLISSVTAGVHMLSLQTVGAVPDHRCRIPEVDSLVNSTFTIPNLEEYVPKLENTFDSCHMYNFTSENSELIKCNSWIYDTTYYKSSRGMEWNFVCDRRWMAAVAQSAFMFGVFAGAITLGSAADKYGRKTIFCWSSLFQLVFGVSAAFISDYYAFLIVQFGYGLFGSAGCYLPGFVLAMELVGPSKRTVCGITFQAGFALGIILVAGWAAIISDKQILQLVYGMHGLLLLGHWWLIDESPRWLWANGKITEAVKIIQKGLRINGSSLRLDPADYFTKVTKTSKTAHKANVSDLFKMPVLRKRTLNICLAWFANSLVYYGLSLGTGKLYGNPFVLLCLIGLVEFPGYTITVFLMDRTGRRSLMSFFMILGGICCIIAEYLFKGSVASTAFIMIGMFSIGSSFAIVYNYSAELFPTVIRNSALGLGAMSATLSGGLTPLISLLDFLNPALPTTIFAAISIVSGFLILFLPETMGCLMPESLQDGETFRVNDTAFTSCFSKKNKQNCNFNDQMRPLNPV
ncbi:hypothetical protein FQR65_LT02620 [Abscondita terminalis]|nr:hypothetical protein FQR65_LT02620 [Abscondita terminalis]